MKSLRAAFAVLLVLSLLPGAAGGAPRVAMAAASKRVSRGASAARAAFAPGVAAAPAFAATGLSAPVRLELGLRSPAARGDLLMGPELRAIKGEDFDARFRYLPGIAGDEAPRGIPPLPAVRELLQAASTESPAEAKTLAGRLGRAVELRTNGAEVFDNNDTRPSAEEASPTPAATDVPGASRGIRRPGVLGAAAALSLAYKKKLGFAAPTSPVYAPDGKTVMALNHSGTLHVFDAASGNAAFQIKLQGETGAEPAVSPDGALIAAKDDNAKLYVIDAPARKVRFVKEMPMGLMGAPVFSPDGRSVAVGGLEKKLHIFDALSGKTLQTIETNAALFRSASFSPTGALVAVTDATDGLYVSRVPGATLYAKRNEGHMFTTRPVFSPDGKSIAAGTYGGKILVFNTETGGIVHRLQTNDVVVSDPVFSDDGRRIIAGTKAGVIHVFDVQSREILSSHETGGMVFPVLSPDGRLLAAGSHDGIIYVFDVESGDKLLKFKTGAMVESRPAFSPDGRQLAGTSDDGNLYVFTVRSERRAARATHARNSGGIEALSGGGNASRGSPPGGEDRPDGERDFSGFLPASIVKYRDGGTMKMRGRIDDSLPADIRYDGAFNSPTRGGIYAAIKPASSLERLMTTLELQGLKTALGRFLGRAKIGEYEYKLYREFLGKIKAALSAKRVLGRPWADARIPALLAEHGQAVRAASGARNVGHRNPHMAGSALANDDQAGDRSGGRRQDGAPPAEETAVIGLANSYIADHGDKFGLGPQDAPVVHDVRIDTVGSWDRIARVRYEPQRYHGVVVEGTGIEVIISLKSNAVVNSGGAWFADLNVPLAPQIPENQARQNLVGVKLSMGGHGGGPVRYTVRPEDVKVPGQLVILPLEEVKKRPDGTMGSVLTGFKLTWKITTGAEGGNFLSHWTVYVDAVSGAVAEYYSLFNA